MDTKKIIIIGGIVAVIGGIGLYMWSKSKKSAEGDAEAPADSTKSAEETTDEPKKIGNPNVIVDNTVVRNSSAPLSAPAPKPAPVVLSTVTPRPISSTAILGMATAMPSITNAMPSITKLTPQQLSDKLAICGNRPIIFSKRLQYDKCRSTVISGLRSQGLIAFDGSYSFEGLLDNDFFSGFDSNFDLNL